MTNNGKCPKCDEVLSHIKIEHVAVAAGLLSKLRAVSYVCPGCHAVLGVGIDPVALKSDTVEEVVKRLR